MRKAIRTCILILQASSLASILVPRVETYFANPYSSLERGSNENMNGLVRQYFPKGTDFKTITPAALAHTERKLNNRPRKFLTFKTPIKVFYSPDNN